MERVLGRYSAQLYALLRIVAGLTFMQHGAQKILGALGGFGGQPGQHAQYFSRFGLAGFIELFGGLLLVLGLFAGFVAFICSGEMAFAYFLAHFPRGFFTVQNQGELAVVYCFLFLYIASRGAGTWSIDSLRSKKSA
jgi:putative oxidoreductase